MNIQLSNTSITSHDYHFFFIVGTIKIQSQDFASGTVDKESTANAGEMGSTPGPRRLHMPLSN